MTIERQDTNISVTYSVVNAFVDPGRDQLVLFDKVLDVTGQTSA